MKRLLSLLFVCLCFTIFANAVNNIKDTTIIYCDTIHYDMNGSRTTYYRYEIKYQVNLLNHNAKISRITALGQDNNISWLEYLTENNYIDSSAIYVEVPETISINNEFYIVDSILNFEYFSPAYDIYRGIKIPKTIKFIACSLQPFTIMKHLEWFEVDAENPYYSSVSGCLCDKTGKVLICYPVCQREDITVPEGFEEVRSYAFAPATSYVNNPSTVKTIRLASTIKKMASPADFACPNLESVYIPTLSQWYNIDFNGPYELQHNFDLYADGNLVSSITLPDSVQRVKYGQFMGCNLDTVIIPEGITNIEEHAFNRSTIKCVYIPTTIDSIKYAAFSATNSLKYVHINDINKWCQINFEFPTSQPLYYAHNLYVNGELVTNLEINNSISKYAFYGYTSLVSVNIGSQAKSIGEWAFYECSNLSRITLNEGVVSLEKESFAFCKQIKNINLPQSLLKIGERCFSSDSITTLIIPSSVDTIDSYFLAHNPIKDITFMATNPSKYSGDALNPDIYHIIESIENIYIACGTYDIYSSIFKEAKDLLREPTFDYSYQVTINNELGKFAYNHTPDCSDSTLTIEVTPYSWAHFVQWSDGNTDNPRSIKVDQDTILSAELEYNNVTLTLSCDDEKGTVVGSGTYPYNTEVTISATPKHGYKFYFWNGDSYSKEQTYTFTIVNDMEMVAHFTPETYTVTIQSENEEMGYAYGSTTAEYLSTIEISAYPNYGYHFAQWSDENKENPRQFVVEYDTALIAIFEPDTFAVYDYNGEDGYTIGGGSYPYMAEISATAIPNKGYDFYSWDDGIYETTRTITITGEMYLYPIFGKHLYQVNIYSNDYNMGSVNYSGENQFYYQDEIRLEAYPSNERYEFDRWSDGNTENPRTIIIDRDIELTAYFREASEGIEDIHIDSSIPHKIIIDGQVYILRGDKIYTLQGKEVK